MRNLRKELQNLKENHSLVGVKGGTEVEGMSFEEIYFMREVSQGIVPMTVKIGGPEARNDIDYMLSIGVDKILAPMVESPYGLRNFVLTINEMNKSNDNLKLAINIETITAYFNLHAIFQSEYFSAIDQVTVGRTDLSGSMSRDVDDKKVNLVTKKIVERSKLHNKKTSVGGKVTSENAPIIKRITNPDYINTRHMLVKAKSPNVANDIEAALLWEKKFYQYLRNNFSSREKFYIDRIKSTENRLSKESVL